MGMSIISESIPIAPFCDEWAAASPWTILAARVISGVAIEIVKKVSLSDIAYLPWLERTWPVLYPPGLDVSLAVIEANKSQFQPCQIKSYLASKP